MTSVPTYHVLLVGFDHYPGANSLRGCVNDIDAVERLLLTAPGIGIPPEQIRITRLAAPHPDVRSTSRYTAETLPPTKANFTKSLKTLSGPSVRPIVSLSITLVTVTSNVGQGLLYGMRRSLRKTGVR